MEKTKVMRFNAKNQELIMIDGQGVAEAVAFLVYLLGSYSL